MPLPWGYAPPSNTWFFGPTRVTTPNSIFIGSAVLQGSRTWQTDRQTDHATPCVAIGRYRKRQCDLIIIIIIIINNNNIVTMFMVLSSWPDPLREFTRFFWRVQTQRHVAANPQTKPTDLSCEYACRLLLSTSPSPFIIITQPESWYSFYRPTVGGRLSRSRHCSKGVQPLTKPVYRSSCSDKHSSQRRDFNVGRHYRPLQRLLLL